VHLGTMVRRRPTKDASVADGSSGRRIGWTSRRAAGDPFTVTSQAPILTSTSGVGIYRCRSADTSDERAQWAEA